MWGCNSLVMLIKWWRCSKSGVSVGVCYDMLGWWTESCRQRMEKMMVYDD